MTVEELADELRQLIEVGYGKLLISDQNNDEIMICKIELSTDGVGQFVKISKDWESK